MQAGRTAFLNLAGERFACRRWKLAEKERVASLDNLWPPTWHLLPSPKSGRCPHFLGQRRP